VADSKSKPSFSGTSGGPPAPSFYSAAAGMKPGGAGDQPPGAGTSAGQSGEKVKNVQVLLEVFDKMDKLEQDPTNKKLIQEMVDKAKEYLQMLEGKGTKPTSMPATGEAGSGGGMGSTMGAGGGAGGPGVGAPEMGAGAAA
jgi:hypothetical protein